MNRLLPQLRLVMPRLWLVAHSSYLKESIVTAHIEAQPSAPYPKTTVRVEFSTQPTWETPRNPQDKRRYGSKSSRGWKRLTCSIPELYYDHIRLGHPVTAVFKGNYRKTANFLWAWLLMLDLDEIAGLSVEGAVRICFFGQNAAIIYPSPSSTPEHPKTRILLVLETPITDADRFQGVMEQLLTHLDVVYGVVADWSTTGAQCFFFGSDLPGAFVQEAVLPDKALAELNYPPEMVKKLREYRLQEAQDFQAGKVTKAKPAALVLFEATTPTLPITSKAISSPRSLSTTNHQPNTTKPANSLRFPIYDLTGLSGREVFALYIQAVKDRLPGDVVKGKHVRCPNPNHVDEHPSFRISYDRNPEGQPICTCGVQSVPHNWKVVGEWVGLDYNHWLAAQLNPTARLPKTPTPQRGLPNSLREYLLQNKQHGAARVLDILLLEGCPPGWVFTLKDILPICEQHGIGRKTVSATVKISLPPCPDAIASGARPLADAPANLSSDQDVGAVDNFVPIFHRNTAGEGDTATQCSGQNGNKIKRGRPAQEYVMPDITELCRKLGIQPKGSDALEGADLSTAKRYRMALNRKFIQRHPGQHTKKFLSKRLGVSNRTAYNYAKEDDHIQVEPQFKPTPLTLDNVHIVDEITAVQPHGVYLQVNLQDGTHKDYPPSTSIAKRLLREGKSVDLIRQEANFYRYVEQPARPSAVELPAAEVEQDARAAQEFKSNEQAEVVTDETGHLTITHVWADTSQGEQGVAQSVEKTPQPHLLEATSKPLESSESGATYSVERGQETQLSLYPVLGIEGDSQTAKGYSHYEFDPLQARRKSRVQTKGAGMDKRSKPTPDVERKSSTQATAALPSSRDTKPIALELSERGLDGLRWDDIPFPPDDDADFSEPAFAAVG